jgi:hypothetical protein
MFSQARLLEFDTLTTPLSSSPERMAFVISMSV